MLGHSTCGAGFVSSMPQAWAFGWSYLGAGANGAVFCVVDRGKLLFCSTFSSLAGGLVWFLMIGETSASPPADRVGFSSPVTLILSALSFSALPFLVTLSPCGSFSIVVSSGGTCCFFSFLRGGRFFFSGTGSGAGTSRVPSSNTLEAASDRLWPSSSTLIQ